MDRRIKTGAVAIAAALAAVAAFDLWTPRAHDLRSFDPAAVARVETAMWRSYYAHYRLHLFTQLAQLLRTQYDFPRLRSYVTAYHAAHAAAVFQRGRSRAGYHKALPDLERFYADIAAVSTQKFSVKRAARLELEWWIVHRERAARPPEDLQRALAELQAELYGLPAEDFQSHARERASAMVARDIGAEHGGPDEHEWESIGTTLARSWDLAWRALMQDSYKASDRRIFICVP